VLQPTQGPPSIPTPLPILLAVHPPELLVLHRPEELRSFGTMELLLKT
jgi:hypothetical protein